MRFLSVILILLASFPAYAQVIDLFDEQDSMPEKTLLVDGMATSEDASNAQGGAPIILRFERQDSSIMVMATIRGKDVYFLFDTGATYTTLTSAFARSVGALPPKDGPTAMMQTANGPRNAPFGLIDRLVLGGRPHSGVTYTLCDACPSGMYKGKPVVGLLGRNVIGRYRYVIDEGTGKIEMSPASHYTDRMRDMELWLSVENSDIEPMGKDKYRIALTVRNRAPKSIADLNVMLECEGGNVSIARIPVPASGKKQLRKELVAPNCANSRIRFEDGRW